MINPMIVEGQIAGGVVQGIGGVLLEHFVYDDEGNPLTTTFLDYLLPTAADVPTIEYGHIETPASTPGWLQGRGGGRRHRRAAGGGQRGERRAGAGRCVVAGGSVHSRPHRRRASKPSAADPLKRFEAFCRQLTPLEPGN